MRAALVSLRRGLAFAGHLRRPAVAWPVGIAVFAGLVALFFLAVPGWIVTADEVANAEERERLQNDVRTTGIQLLAGLVLALGRRRRRTSSREACARISAPSWR